MSDFKFHTPNSWILSSLPDIAGINMGQSPSSSDVNEQGEGIVFFQGKAEFGKLYPTPRKYCTKPTKIASVGDILLSIRAPVGPTNIATETTAIGRGLAAISAHCGLTDPKYLLYYFRCIEPWLSTQGTGSTFKAISGQFIKELKAPLPSFAEQKIIAEKLDTLLAQVDSTKARLEQIPQILKRFRQAVLAAAMNGKLTTQWRLENNELDRINLSDIDFFWRRLRNSKKNKNQHEETLNNTCSSNLPETWLNTKIGNVFDVHVGSTPRRNQPEFWNGDIPWVSSSEVAFCRIYATKEMITKKGLASSSTKIHPAGTVMLAMIGQGKTRGQVAILNIDACHNQNTAAIRVPGDFASSEFLYFYLSQRYNDNREIGAGNNQKAMNKSIVESLIFPLPPLKEQHEIVRRVEQLFAYADTIEKQVNNALTRVNSLTQSILAKAFRGELTAQWRAENPDLISGENSAAALLEKIKAERAASGGKKTSRKKS